MLNCAAAQSGGRAHGRPGSSPLRGEIPLGKMTPGMYSLQVRDGRAAAHARDEADRFTVK